MSRQRYHFIDLVRILACFFVIVNHTNSDIFITEGSVTKTWWVSLAYFFVSKTAVPLFIMITGFNLLDRQEGYKKAGLRLLRVVGALMLFSLFYYVYQWKTGVLETAGFFNFFYTILNYYITNSFWYLYVYIGILIMLPFLQRLASALSKTDLLVFIGISLAVNSVMPIVQHYFPRATYSPMLCLVLFDSYLCLLIIGHYFKKYIKPSRRGAWIVGGAAVLSLGFSVLMTRREYAVLGGSNYLFYDNRDLLPTVLLAVSLFYLAMCIPSGRRVSAVLKAVGDCTFGIYLISDFVIGRLYFLFPLASGVMHRMLAMILMELAVFAVGFGVTFLLRLIPGAKKIL